LENLEAQQINATPVKGTNSLNGNLEVEMTGDSKRSRMHDRCGCGYESIDRGRVMRLSIPLYDKVLTFIFHINDQRLWTGRFIW
jgi:hypothetical protein